MLKPIIGALLIVGTSLSAQAQVTLSAGQSWSYVFSSLPLVGKGSNAEANQGAYWATASGSAPSNSYTISVFSSGLTDPPSHVTAGTSGSTGMIWGGLWKDLQGAFRIDVSAGQVTVSNVTIDVWGPITDPYNPSSADHYQLVVIPAPALTCNMTTNSVGAAQTTFLWSTNFTGYALQSATTVDSRQWITLTNAPVVVGSQYSVITDKVATQQFYRLYKP